MPINNELRALFMKTERSTLAALLLVLCSIYGLHQGVLLQPHFDITLWSGTRELMFNSLSLVKAKLVKQ